MLLLFREEDGGGGAPSPQTERLKVSPSEEGGRTLRLDSEFLLLLQGETDWIMHWGDKVGR